MTTSLERLQAIDKLILSFFKDIPKEEYPTQEEIIGALRMGPPLRIKLRYPKHAWLLEIAIIKIRNLDVREFLDYLDHKREITGPTDSKS